MTEELEDGADAQDQAEIFDETQTTRDGDDIAQPDVARDVYDVTRDGSDSDEDEANDEDFDPDEASDDDLDVMLERDDGVDEPGGIGPDDAARVTTEDTSPADYEPDDLSDDDVKALGYRDEPRPAEPDPHVERQLDHGLEETFPASDPVSIDSVAN